MFNRTSAATPAELPAVEAVSIQKFSSNSTYPDGAHAEDVVVNLFDVKGQQHTYDIFPGPNGFAEALAFVNHMTGREWFVAAAKSIVIEPDPESRRLQEGGIKTYFTMTDDI